MSLHKGRQEPFSVVNPDFDRLPVRRTAYAVDRPSGLRRVVSARALSPHLDSSESLPSEHSSLYDAMLLSYESDHNNGPQSKGKKDNEDGSKAAGASHLQELRSWDSERARRRDKLAVPSLDTIFENRSVSTHRAASSRSGLRHCASVGVSLNTISSYSGVSSRTLPVRRNQYGSKIYSFDDNDIPSLRPRFSFTPLAPRERRHSCSTLSSEGSFDTFRWRNYIVSPAEPTQPIHPPPQRPSTPPGVPSFGSPEALNYDISSLPRSTPRTGQDSSRSLPPATGSPEGGERESGSDDECGCCGIGFRRAIRETTSYITYQPPERLPPGVLARADDGTLIRGRFGARASGHGIGATANLANHPFHQNHLPIARTKDTDIRPPQPVRSRSSHTNSRNEFGLRVSSMGNPSPPSRYRSLLDDHRDLPAPSGPVPAPSSTRTRNRTTPPRLREQMQYSRPASTPTPAGNDASSSSTENPSVLSSTKSGLQRLWNLVSLNVTKCCLLGADDEHEGQRGTELQHIAESSHQATASVAMDRHAT
ncbi:TPA_exp: Uncharacterized protein A8136_3830 [Trichophyton benhamiae CBS 112371]|uniref:Uncharacterized protein n=1 Tax=Arthroderma benhamiae (strain ATCC MYA-4681 / CBS 112371) TaxID=663331 RepID=D4B1L1_ARTBC|nr:uncharacterized protein ARB_02340 [Trichophyton benhamiae CBS 112371]EFE30850.1 hypothetical protein ARB_02340 [Trichophyton benhamiae CBS 112371]DAA74048.1 TPA_exp: Uncharacterized protein A8136_3830 [Trichophyton benhamiae CBS 112371]